MDRTGWVRTVADSPYPQFVFDDSEGPTIQPMFVLPNLRLMQIEDAVSVTKSTLRFTVSGTVTEYKGANYILLESQPAVDSRELVPGMEPPPTTNPGSADQMLDQMLSRDSQRRAAAAAAGGEHDGSDQWRRLSGAGGAGAQRRKGRVAGHRSHREADAQPGRAAV